MQRRWGPGADEVDGLEADADDLAHQADDGHQARRSLAARPNPLIRANSGGLGVESLWCLQVPTMLGTVTRCATG